MRFPAACMALTKVHGQCYLKERAMIMHLKSKHIQGLSATVFFFFPHCWLRTWVKAGAQQIFLQSVKISTASTVRPVKTCCCSWREIWSIYYDNNRDSDSDIMWAINLRDRSGMVFTCRLLTTLCILNNPWVTILSICPVFSNVGTMKCNERRGAYDFVLVPLGHVRVRIPDSFR